MGKYLQMLDELYQPEEKSQIPMKEAVPKPTQALLAPFVGANSKDIHFISDSELQGVGSTNQKEKTVKKSKRELTKPTKDTEATKEGNLTDQEIAEHRINGLKLHDDRVFVRQKLIGIYGTKRLDIVKKYLKQWQQGSSAELIDIKKDNAGRHQANTWLRELYERN